MMKNKARRSFIKNSTMAATGMLAGNTIVKAAMLSNPPSDQVNIAVIGIRSRGKDHYRALTQIPNVRIAMICDIDRNKLHEAVREVEELTGYKPSTETEYRKVLDNKDIHAVSIATPNHWHALQAIWACQAGKDVYVEKPVSHTLQEGRKIVEAARKYNRIVQTGTQARSNEATLQALQFLHEGGLGKIYMARGLCLKPRGSIGHVPDSPIPDGVDWNTFLGPAPYRPFNLNRFHYKWHWFWDTGSGDLGNQGIHQADIARWAMRKDTHPVRIKGTGGFYIWDSDQETPNIQHLEFEYGDGSLLTFEVRGLGTNDEAGIRIGNLIVGEKGWVRIDSEDSGDNQAFMSDIQLRPSGFSNYSEEKGPGFSNDDSRNPDAVVNHFNNWINCIRNRNWQELNADILEGHYSTSLCHLGNIATRLNRALNFNPSSESFIDDDEANLYLTKKYRVPFILPDQV
jgi:predicted dehydrogenase